MGQVKKVLKYWTPYEAFFIEVAKKLAANWGGITLVIRIAFKYSDGMILATGMVIFRAVCIIVTNQKRESWIIKIIGNHYLHFTPERGEAR